MKYTVKTCTRKNNLDTSFIFIDSVIDLDTVTYYTKAKWN